MTPHYFERRIGTAKRYGRFAYEVGRTVPGELQWSSNGPREAVKLGQGRNRREAIADFESRTGEKWPKEGSATEE